MNPRLVRRDIATGDAIRARCREIVSEQTGIESAGNAERDARPESFNTAQLPTFDRTMALERQPVHGVQRQVVANVITATAFVGGSVIWVVPRRRSIVSAQAAIRVCQIDAMRERV